MMNEKIKCIRLMFIFLIGIVIISCPNGNDDSDDQDSIKHLVIEGIGLSANNLTIILSETGIPTDPVEAYGTIKDVTIGSDIYIVLKRVNFNASSEAGIFTNIYWKGTGTYYIWLYNMSTMEIFEYSPSPFQGTIQKINFSERVTKVQWNKFEG